MSELRDPRGIVLSVRDLDRIVGWYLRLDDTLEGMTDLDTELYTRLRIHLSTLEGGW